MATGGKESPQEEKKLCDEFLHLRLSTEEEEECLEFRYKYSHSNVIRIS